MTQSTATSSTQMVLRECGICQSSIFPDEGTTICPSCGLTFHAECWKENWGCAAYGCEQVNVLKPQVAEQKVEDVFQPPIDQPIERLPWNFLLLGASALALAISTLTYGVPSLLVIVALGWRMWTTRRQQQSRPAQAILLAASVLAVVGLIAGILISRYWYA